MESKRVWEVALTVLVAMILLVAAEGKYPYGFYMVLRTVATVGGAYWAVRVYQVGLRGWMWGFLAVAFLLNPILPVRMQRSQWQPIDLWLGIFLLGWSGYWAFRKSSGK
jgi:membrane associated rhomboid family serine protease